MTNDISRIYDEGDVAHFHRDLIQLVRIAKEIDRFCEQRHSDIDRYIPKYNKFINSFNNKYKGITIKVKAGLEGINTQFLLKEKSIRAVFDNAVSKIIGLKAVGASKFNVADIANGNGFMKEVDKGKNKLHITYYDPELGMRNVFLTYDKQENKVELHYDDKQIVLENSPEFKIACLYALRDGFDKKIKVYEEGSVLGFDDLLSEKEKVEWDDKMNPKFLE
ncbi:hypothetical protein ISS05_02730 [Candidatus Woesearchaeota archaeon]|nr:hypothetical protein [Candidatus Woesearchaeota archaeon]